jgi:NADH dehydrogenase
MENRIAHIVVLGAGFGGLTFCQAFRSPRARVTLVDRQNHHLFQPLLYQVATAGLSAPEVAQPARSILRDQPKVSVRLDEVKGIELAKRRVHLASGPLDYDHLVIALGGVTSYFGHPEWEQFAPGLKSLDDALRIRREVLLAFEHAENELNPAERVRLLTIVVVGGGATGLELAGAFAELTRHVLRRDFRHIDSGKARVILLEGGDRLLAHMAPESSASAKRQLESLGVEVRLQAKVSSISQGLVELADGTCIEAANVIWAAGVAASPLTRSLGVETDRTGRLKVLPDLSLPGHPEVFAIGDLALVLQPDGKPVPGVSPAAIQEAHHIAKLIGAELAATTPGSSERPAFKYWDKGTMATIGRSAAVAEIGRIRFSGLVAWLAWLFVHLIFLVGFRNKAAVLLQWFYSYCTYRRGARIITGVARTGAEGT